MDQDCTFSFSDDEDGMELIVLVQGAFTPTWPGAVSWDNDTEPLYEDATIYSFTTNQAPVVRLLYEHWQAGTPDVGDETLLFSVDPEAPPARLSTLFRDHPAWGTMIVAGGSKGTHRLSTPGA